MAALPDGWTVKAERVTWIRWDARRMRDVISHPTFAALTDPWGDVRYFDTVADAKAYANGYGS